MIKQSSGASWRKEPSHEDYIKNGEIEADAYDDRHADPNYQTSGQMQEKVCQKEMLSNGSAFDLMTKMGLSVDVNAPSLKQNVENTLAHGRSSSKMVKTLQESGFSFDRADEEGSPYLTLATKNPNIKPDAYRALLDCEVDLERPDAHGKKASDYASGYKALLLNEKKESALSPVRRTTQTAPCVHPRNGR